MVRKSSRRRKSRKTVRKAKVRKSAPKVEKKATDEKKKVVEFDVMVHVLVPKHVKLSDKEKAELEERVGNLNLLPKIKRSDPALRGLDVRPGDVIKIIRPNELVPYYRVVVEE